MEIIVKQGPITSKLLAEQKIENNILYRPFYFIKTLPIEDGFLIYNVMTGELLFLDSAEIHYIDSIYYDGSNLMNLLIKKWFLVPYSLDDLTISKQHSDLLLSFNRMKKSIPISMFTILPTTDCNARCFYCYELGGRRLNMSEQTAYDVADFIAKKWDGKCAHLRWFGGEPLYNSKVIDIICNSLKQKGIMYDSVMISNGYLLDESTISKAVNLWKIKWVQITLDGTEKIYNKCKAYIYCDDSSPFKKVWKNIKSALDADISVRIRLNMDDHNENDLFELTELLLNDFSSYDKFLIYTHLLFEDSCARISARADDDRHKLIESQIKLQKYIYDRIKVRALPLGSSDRVSHCMSDSDDMTMILPDGKLGKCEHYTEDNFYGSIYDDNIDYNVINRFKDTTIVGSNCDNCELRPSCIFPKMCSSMPLRCDEYDKMLRILQLEQRIIATYEHYKKGLKNNETKI